MKKRQLYKIRKSFVHQIFLALFLSLILFIYSFIRTSHNPLTSLPVPQLASVSFSGPLQLPFLDTSILGAQAIDPIDVVKFINIERSKKGVKPLRLSEKLMNAAQMRADVILKYQNFSHQDPYENIELVTVMPKVSYQYRYASENIGMGGISAEDFVFGFMHSTSHRENLLNQYLSDTGVAVVTGPYKQYYVNIAVQLFAIPATGDETLGYSRHDVEKYKKIIADIDGKLNPVVWTVNSVFDQDNYSQNQFTKLTNQKELLKKVFETMNKNQPLTSVHVAMILEYNNNL